MKVTTTAYNNRFGSPGGRGIFRFAPAATPRTPGIFFVRTGYRVITTGNNTIFYKMDDDDDVFRYAVCSFSRHRLVSEGGKKK